MYKIGSIFIVDSAPFELKDPETGALLGTVVTLAGPSHSARIALQSARVKRAQTVFQRDGRVDLPSFEEQQDQRIEDACAAVLGWSGVDVEFSPAAARKWFSDPREAWVVNQIAEALADQKRFIGRSESA